MGGWVLLVAALGAVRVVAGVANGRPVLFLILLVGTTLEILAERTRTAYRLSRWRRGLKDHTIVCGYGTKGRAAATVLAPRALAEGIARKLCLAHSHLISLATGRG